MDKIIKQRIASVKNGKVPDGYKIIKNIGILPNHWREGQLFDIVRNEARSIKKPQSAYWRLGLRSHAKGTFHELVENPESVEMDELFSVCENDLIVNITFAWEHAIAVADKNDAGLLVSHRFPTYVFKEGNSSQFYKYVVIQKWFKDLLEQISPGGAGRNRVMSKPAFLKLPCFIPPALEQNKIAEILGCCDNVISLKKELITEKKKQKKALMQKLLNPQSGFRLPGFSGKWKRKKLGDLFIFLPSLSASRDQLGNEGVAYLHYGDIHKSSKNYIDVAWELNELPKLPTTNPPKQFLLKDGDVVFVDASEDYDGASKHIVIINSSNISFVSGLHTIIARSKSDSLSIGFKQYCFQSCAIKKQVAFYISGMKVFGLSRDNIARIELYFPEKKNEQQAIANILSRADKEINLLEQELAEWEKKKKALMQLLLTGIVRVK